MRDRVFARYHRLVSEPRIATRLVAPLLDACAKHSGVGSALDLRKRFGIDDAALEDPESRLALSRFYELLESAVERTGDDNLGLHYSLALDPTAFDVLGFLALTSPTFGVSLDRMVRYQALLYEGDAGTITRHGDRVTVSLESWGPPRLAHRLWVEAGMVDMVVNGRRLVGQDFDVHEVRVRHERHPGADALSAALGTPVVFAAEDNAVVLPADVLELRLPSADPAMFAFFDREAARRVAEHGPPPTDLLDEVRRAVQSALPEGVPELASLADALHMSPRTLQRRLADEHDTSLRKLVDDLRHQLALRHLAAGLSIAEVSFLLGFSEPSAFHRAFRRWTDRTPTQWRIARR